MSGYTANVIAPHGVLDDGYTSSRSVRAAGLAAKIRAALEREP